MDDASEQSLGSALGSAWNSVKNFFAEIPSHLPCIPCLFKKAQIVGPNWKKAVGDVFPGQQSYNNCGLQSARQIVEQAKGKVNKTELQFMDDAIASCGALKDAVHPDYSGGTSADARQCVMQQYGVASTQETATLANVDAALRQGKGVIISSNADKLWSTQGYPPGVGGGGRHAVVVTNGLYDTSGNMTGVHVNDTGINMQYELTSAQLEDCLNSGSGVMNVTSSRIWPTD